MLSIEEVLTGVSYKVSEEWCKCLLTNTTSVFTLNGCKQKGHTPQKWFTTNGKGLLQGNDVPFS